jgi:hypothetical protein
MLAFFLVRLRRCSGCGPADDRAAVVGQGVGDDDHVVDPAGRCR